MGTLMKTDFKFHRAKKAIKEQLITDCCNLVKLWVHSGDLTNTTCKKVLTEPPHKVLTASSKHLQDTGKERNQRKPGLVSKNRVLRKGSYRPQ